MRKGWRWVEGIFRVAFLLTNFRWILICIASMRVSAVIPGKRQEMKFGPTRQEKRKNRSKGGFRTQRKTLIRINDHITTVEDKQGNFLIWNSLRDTDAKFPRQVTHVWYPILETKEIVIRRVNSSRGFTPCIIRLPFRSLFIFLLPHC